jgi:hypothetical protein
MTDNNKFTVGKFHDFSRPFADLSTLMDEFQCVQAHRETAEATRNESKLVFQRHQEYLDLCENYQELFSNMLKKLLDAKTNEEISKIRAATWNKLGPVLQKLEVISKAINGEVSAKTTESRNVVTDKFEQIKDLLTQAQKLKNDTKGPNASVLSNDVIVAPL